MNKTTMTVEVSYETIEKIVFDVYGNPKEQLTIHFYGVPVSLYQLIAAYDAEYRKAVEPYFDGRSCRPHGHIDKSIALALTCFKLVFENLKTILPNEVRKNTNLINQVSDFLGDYPTTKKERDEVVDIICTDCISDKFVEYVASYLINGLMSFKKPDKHVDIFETVKQSKRFEALIQRLGARNQAILAIDAYAALQATQAPKGSGGNTRKTNHRQGLAKKIIHELFEQYPDKSGGEICSMLNTKNFQLDGWRVERHVGSMSEQDNYKKDRYIIESDQGTDDVAAGTIDTWLSKHRKKVK